MGENSRNSQFAICLFVGPQKTATTWLEPKIRSMQGVSMPRGIKETFFFDRFANNGVDWYLSLFTNDSPLICEVGPSYFGSDSARNEIATLFPEAKIVITLRSPVERSISHFRHLRRYGVLSGSLEENLSVEAEHISCSRYSKWVPLWRSAFGDRNVMLVDSRAFEESESARGCLGQIAEFLGVEKKDFSDSELQERAYEGGATGNPLLARVCSAVSMGMKKRGMYSLLDFARKSPLHGWAYGRSGKAAASEPHLQQTELRLRELLEEEVKYYEEVFDGSK